MTKTIVVQIINKNIKGYIRNDIPFIFSYENNVINKFSYRKGLLK